MASHNDGFLCHVLRDNCHRFINGILIALDDSETIADQLFPFCFIVMQPNHRLR
jgi:hypothetical protein